jgi:hypothetical protein
MQNLGYYPHFEKKIVTMSVGIGMSGLFYFAGSSSIKVHWTMFYFCLGSFSFLFVVASQR